MKKTSLSIITALVLSFNSANATGFPVVDIGSIAQSVLNYSQTINQYKQMLADTILLKQQISEMGADMTSVNDILGNLTSMIRDMENVQSSISGADNNVLGNVEQVQRACSFLQTKSPYFKDKLSSVSRSIQNDFNRCTFALKNDYVINQSIDVLMDKINKSTDKEEQEQYYTEIQNIQNAQRFIKQKANEEQSNRIIAFYDTYHKNDKNNAYTKAKMDNDLKELSKALNKENNQKQAQALTNSILIKILETMQKQYELNMEYSNALINFSQNSNMTNNNSFNEDSYNLTYKAKTLDDVYRFGNYDDYKIQTDENGLPTFTIDSPAKKENSILGE